MTIQIENSVQSQIYNFIAREHDVFAGLDVDHHSIAAMFTDHGRLMQSLRLPYSSTQMLNYVRKNTSKSAPCICIRNGVDGVWAL